MKKKRTWKTWAKIVIIVYCLIGIAFFYLQEKAFFHPVALAADSVYHFTQPFVETKLALDSKTTISIVQFTVPDTVRKGIVLYFHGNRENINRYARFAPNFTRNGYEVWMPDYPGYGRSTGQLSEALLYEEALQVYKLARTKYPADSIIIYGKSIGTGIAAQLASVRDCRKLILETPYYSLISLIRRVAWMYPLDMLMHYKIPAYAYLEKVTAPVSIFHGTEDGVIPYSHAEKLRSVLKKGDEFITIDGGAHTNLYTFPLFHHKLDSLLR